MACAHGKLLVQTASQVGVEIPTMPGYRMMQSATATENNLTGDPLTCPICPYRTRCDERSLTRDCA
jgi:hypothetical protein